MGIWSEISVHRSPFNDLSMSKMLVRILSISVAECEVMRVGFVINGINTDE